MKENRESQKTAIFPVLEFLAQTLRRRGSVLPLPPKIHTAWARDLGLKRGGETVIFTGHMYQMMPYLKALQRRRKALDSRRQILLLRLAKSLNPYLNLAYLSTWGQVRLSWRREYEAVLKSIVLLLWKNGIEPGYLYEEELYPGTLVYDLGLDGVFEEQAHKVFKALKRAGVKTVITVDPHSTHILKQVYPQVIPGFDLEVVPYLQLLMKKDLKGLTGQEGTRVTIHDSCIYARYLGMVKEVRELVEKTGAIPEEVRFSGEITHCCGGPIETLFPEKAQEIARSRLEELGQAEGEAIITLCPICHLNLSENSPQKRVIDLASFLTGNL